MIWSWAAGRHPSVESASAPSNWTGRNERSTPSTSTWTSTTVEESASPLIWLLLTTNRLSSRPKVTFSALFMFTSLHYPIIDLLLAAIHVYISVYLSLFPSFLFILGEFPAVVGAGFFFHIIFSAGGCPSLKSHQYRNCLVSMGIVALHIHSNSSHYSISMDFSFLFPSFQQKNRAREREIERKRNRKRERGLVLKKTNIITNSLLTKKSVPLSLVPPISTLFLKE